MKTLTLSGWGQPHDALSVVAPDATHFDYSGYKSVDEALSAIAEAVKQHDAVIGWSLGGQLAVRAIAAGLMQPKKLVLIAAPFQFVHNDVAKIGMPRDKFQKFRANYDRNPARTLDKAWELVVMGDGNESNIRAQMAKYSPQESLKKDWLLWLDMLDGFSSKELDFSTFPDSLLLHGEKDAVVDHTQSHEFTKIIPQTKHIAFPDAGHAPHWHDSDAVKQHILEFLYV